MKFCVMCFLLCMVFSNQTAIHGQEFVLEPVHVVPDPQPGVPVYRFCPDGHIPFLRDGNLFQMYWAGNPTYRTLGQSLSEMMNPQAVLRPGPTGSYDNGGAWLYAVFRRSENSLIGFYHAEDRQFKAVPDSKGIAWKSIALCMSDDNGTTWQKKGRIVTSSREKPEKPTSGGCGDFCVIRDEKDKRWVCFYQEHYLCMAVSEDQDGKPGTWKKYYQGSFSEPGLGGQNTPLPSLAKYAGGNPSVHFNTLLKKWVMVWHTWDHSSPKPNSIWLSTSDDLLYWTAPNIVLEAKGKERYWYPTMIGDSDVRCGAKSLLCYAYFPYKSKNERQFVVREFLFKADR